MMECSFASTCSRVQLKRWAFWLISRPDTATPPALLALPGAYRILAWIKASTDGSLKDTARNLQVNKECVVQLCRQSDLAAVHTSAAALPPGQSEVKELGMNLVPSQHVRVPRLDGAAVQMECKLDQVVDLGRGVNQLHILEVLAFHVDSSLMDEKGKVDLEVYRPLARWAGPYYAQRGDIFLP